MTRKTDRQTDTKDAWPDQNAAEWKQHYEEAEQARCELADILNAIQRGEVDTILANKANPSLLRLLDATLVEETERTRRELADVLTAIQMREVDTIITNETHSGMLRLLDAKLVDENEHLVEELSRSNQKFRQVFEQSNDGIILLDWEGYIVDVNLRAQNMWGYTHDEFLKLNIVDLHSLRTAEKSVSLLPAFQRAANSTNATDMLFDVEFKRKNTSLFDAEVSAGGMTLNGKASILAMVRDITARQAMKTEILRSNKELQDFSCLVSHDLRMLIRNIRSFINNLMRDETNQLSEESQEDLRHIEKASSKIQALINTILQYSKIGGKTLTPISVNLNIVLSETMTEWQPLLQQIDGSSQYRR